MSTDVAQQRRFVVMTAAQFVARAVDQLDPRECGDLDVVAFVLQSVHQQFGPTQWASTPPSEYVLAAQQLLPFCRDFSNPLPWYDELQAGVAALEARKRGPATMAEVGEVLRAIDEDPSEQVSRLLVRFVLSAIMQAMLRNVDASDEDVAAEAHAELMKHVAGSPSA
jgi:hypothetical protein